MSLLRLGNYDVPGHELKIGGGMEIRTSDASGETSGTDEADKGFKAMKFTVSLRLPFTDAAALKKLIRVASAKENGKRKIYTIANDTANVMGVRQVRFVERFHAEEVDGLRAWDVSFTLKEYLSNSEREELRESPPAAVAQNSEGKSIIDSAIQQAVGVEKTAQEKEADSKVKEALGQVETAMKFMDVLPPSMVKDVKGPITMLHRSLKDIDDRPAGVPISTKETMLGVKKVLTVTDQWPASLSSKIKGPLETAEKSLKLAESLPVQKKPETEEAVSEFEKVLNTINEGLA